MIDFGRHVAALWEDREPSGALGADDLVIHHLGGFPEIVTLGELAATRPIFALRVPRSDPPEPPVRLAGDVVLAGDDLRTIDGFGQAGAALFLANLESVPSLANPTHPPRFDFRFPPQRLPWLRDQGVDAVSLANNHAGDAGETGLLEAIDALKTAGIGVCGAGPDSAAACKPWRTRRHGRDFAVFGICLVDAPAASHDRPGVAKLPEHANLLNAEILRAAAAGERIIALVHGDDEYHIAVNDDQRR